MVPLHHQTKFKKSGENYPPVPPPPPQRRRGEEAPIENCAKKRRVGTNTAHLSTPYCTEVTSLCAPLEIEGHTNGDGEELPAPVGLSGAVVVSAVAVSPFFPRPAPHHRSR